MSDIFSIIGASWDIFKKHSWKLIGIVLLGFALELPYLLAPYLPKALAAIFALVFAILIGIYTLGLIKVGIKAVDNEPFEVFDTLKLGFPTLVKCSVAGLFYILGFMVCALPLILMAIVPIVGPALTILALLMFVYTFMFVMYFIIDEDTGPVEAFFKSSNITSGEKLNLLALTIVLGLLNIMGALLLLVGLLVTWPLSWISLAYAFRQLNPLTESAPTKTMPHPQSSQPYQPNQPEAKKEEPPPPVKKQIDVDW